MKILIDNGHGSNTAGKRSPDGTLMEWSYTREIAASIVSELRSKGYDAERIVPEERDISLSTRCQRVNSWCNKLGTSNVLLISIHVNAAGTGSEWRSAGGWCAYTTKGKTKADDLATCLYKTASESLKEYAKILNTGKATGKYDSKQRAIRTDYTDGDPDQEAAFYIIKTTKCPAVLTENLFQDNREDVRFLLSEAGKRSIVNLHVQGIIYYIGKK